MMGSDRPPLMAHVSSQGHWVWSMGAGTLDTAMSEQRSKAGLCFTADGQQFPPLQRHTKNY